MNLIVIKIEKYSLQLQLNNKFYEVKNKNLKFNHFN